MRTLAISHERNAGPGVFAEAIAARRDELDIWHIADTSDPPADPFSYGAVITFGASIQVDQEDSVPYLVHQKALLRELIDRRVPLLGVCLGAQLVAEAAGGAAREAPEPEVGWYEVEVTEAGREDALIGPLAPSFEALQWHSYECLPPPDAVILARSTRCVQAFRTGPCAWGIQFHAEVAAADVAEWIREDWQTSAAARVGIVEERFQAETAARIGAWNELGRSLCGRFLDEAAVPAAP